MPGAHRAPVLTGAESTVLVIGNGPVGQTTALLLARWGVPVVLLDGRAERDAAGSRAICQQRDVLDVWDFVGAGAIAREGLTWTRARTFYQDRELFVVDLPDPGRSPLPPFVNISQSRTEELLDEQIAANPLIDVRWGHDVVGLDQDASGVRVTARTATGEAVLAGRYAVACGGARGSRLRRLLGVGFPGRSFEDSFLICDIRAALPGWEQERRFYFDPRWNPGRQVLIHPCPDGILRIDWQVETGFDLGVATADGMLDQRIRQVVGQHPYEVVWSSVYRFHSRLATRMRVGRVLLAGDLAHLVAPFGARGLNSGVGDADNAAWKLAFVLHGWAPEALLDTYALEREAAARENLRVTTATMDFLVPQTPQEARRRHRLLEGSLTDPALRERVDSGRLAEPYWYVDSPLTTRRADRPWPGPPARGATADPVPGVVLPDGPLRERGGPCRVRTLVRGAVTVLSGPRHEAECADALADLARSGVPVQVLGWAGADPDGVLRRSLRSGPEDLWLVRPDAFTAAMVDSPSALPDAVDRVMGQQVLPSTEDPG